MVNELPKVRVETHSMDSWWQGYKDAHSIKGNLIVPLFVFYCVCHMVPHGKSSRNVNQSVLRFSSVRNFWIRIMLSRENSFSCHWSHLNFSGKEPCHNIIWPVLPFIFCALFLSLTYLLPARLTPWGLPVSTTTISVHILNL